MVTLVVAAPLGFLWFVHKQSFASMVAAAMVSAPPGKRLGPSVEQGVDVTVTMTVRVAVSADEVLEPGGEAQPAPVNGGQRPAAVASGAAPSTLLGAPAVPVGTRGMGPGSELKSAQAASTQRPEGRGGPATLVARTVTRVAEERVIR